MNELSPYGGSRHSRQPGLLQERWPLILYPLSLSPILGLVTAMREVNDRIRIFHFSKRRAPTHMNIITTTVQEVRWDLSGSSLRQVRQAGHQAAKIRQLHRTPKGLVPVCHVSQCQEAKDSKEQDLILIIIGHTSGPVADERRL